MSRILSLRLIHAMHALTSSVFKCGALYVATYVGMHITHRFAIDGM